MKTKNRITFNGNNDGWIAYLFMLYLLDKMYRFIENYYKMSKKAIKWVSQRIPDNNPILVTSCRVLQLVTIFHTNVISSISVSFNIRKQRMSSCSLFMGKLSP